MLDAPATLRLRFRPGGADGLLIEGDTPSAPPTSVLPSVAESGLIIARHHGRRRIDHTTVDARRSTRLRASLLSSAPTWSTPPREPTPAPALSPLPRSFRDVARPVRTRFRQRPFGRSQRGLFGELMCWNLLLPPSIRWSRYCRLDWVFEPKTRTSSIRPGYRGEVVACRSAIRILSSPTRSSSTNDAHNCLFWRIFASTKAQHRARRCRSLSRALPLLA